MESDSSSATAMVDHQQHSSSPAASSLVPKTEPGGFIGKHRMAAAVSHLQNQISLLQEELDQLETLGESSIVCKELISSVESIPDPLLPLTHRRKLGEVVPRSTQLS
ncbi:guanine nucleotide-binding protein subunit gamma 2 isoform X2 [Ricinus communis]|uniref:guanine nucleotide-binding protein subunit gamma 2 isoform X2 n=1 Tax=Ricinus communis TaxID=3988 RepID=UPI000772A0B6|nr:guanine nucleotide-binding protein subunit gamma 2 isoform X2 [Ricinus communis]|eukprot:XP_015575392.1 guanine nucleotide-binding protein subunit gamma 2 isoform X2 [Ricinus communis]